MRWLSVTALCALIPCAAVAQDKARTVVHYGIAFGARSGLYSDMFGLNAGPASTIIRAGVSPRGELLLDYWSKLWEATPTMSAAFYGRVSGVDQRRFHGMGNASLNVRPTEYYAVEQYRFILASKLELRPNRRLRLGIGPVLHYSFTESDIEPGIVRVIGDPLPANTGTGTAVSPSVDFEDVGLMQLMAPYGTGTFGEVGLQADLDWNVMAGDSHPLATRFAAQVATFPALWSLDAPFTTLRAHWGGFFTAPGPAAPQLGVSLGAQKVWGQAPFQELAYVGGRGTLRGFRKHRFAGDAAVYANTELRFTVWSGELGAPVRAGVLGFFDAGRVFVAGQSPGGWHTAHGGGIWVARAGDPTKTISVALARGGEGLRWHVGFGLPY